MFWFLVGALAIAALTTFVILRPNRSNWHLSENKNQARLYKGSRITVFESGGGWKFCIADPVDDGDPYFSDPYETQRAAMESCIAMIDNNPSPHQSLRDIRDEKKLSSSLEITAQSSSLLAGAKEKIRHMHRTGKFLVKDIEPIQKTCKTQIRFIIDVYQNHYLEGRSDEADKIWLERKEFIALESHCNELLTWIRSGTKNDRGPAPSFPQ